MVVFLFRRLRTIYSNIDTDLFSPQGYPFAQYGTALTPSSGNSSQYSTGNAIICQPRFIYFSAAYNLPSDNRTLTYSDNTDLFLSISLTNTSSGKKAHISRHL